MPSSLDDCRCASPQDFRLWAALLLLAVGSASATERLDDPLPPGALGRLGTTRLRHGIEVTAVAFTPDGKILASAGLNGLGGYTVRLWDSHDGHELRQFKVEGRVRALAISPRGKLLATAERGIHLREIASGKETRVHMDETHFTSVAFSPSGKLLAAGGSGKIIVWDVASGKKRSELKGHHRNHEVEVVFSGDRTLVAVEKYYPTDDASGTVCCWDVTTGRKVRSWRAPGEETERDSASLAATADGKLLATGHWKVIRLWEVATGKELRQFPTPDAHANRLAFSPDGKTLLSGMANSTVRLWDVATGRERVCYTGGGYHQSVAFSPDGKSFVVGGEDGLLRLRKFGSGEDAVPLPGHRGPVQWVAAAAGGRTFISGGRDRTVRLWDATTGKETRRLEVRDYNGPRAGALSADGKRLAIADGTLMRLWKLPSGEVVDKFAAPRKIMALALSPDGRSVALGDEAGHVYCVSSGRAVLQLPEHSHQVTALAFSPDGKFLFSASLDEGARLWELPRGRKVWEVKYPLGWCLSAAFAPDGSLLATGTSEGLVWLRDARTGREVGKLNPERFAVRCVCFSPDGKLLAVGNGRSMDHNHAGTTGVTLWDMLTRSNVGSFGGHTDGINGLAFTPDGRAFLSASDDTTILVWGLLPRGKMPRLDPARAWADFASAKAIVACRTTWALAADPAVALPLLRERLKPAEKPGAASRRALRAVQALELIGSPEAEKLLKALGRGQAEAGLTAETRAALTRLAQRRQPPPAVPWKGHADDGGPRILQDHSGEVTGLAFAPDGRTLASVALDGKLLLAEVDKGRVIFERRAHRGGAFAVAYAPDGKRLATAGGDGLVRLWDAVRRQELRVLKGHKGDVAAVAFAPDGRTLASGGYDGQVILWEVSSGKRLKSFRATTGRITALSFSPDGKQLAVGGTIEVSEDNIGQGVSDHVTLWEVGPGKKIRTFAGRGSVVAFSADGRFVVSAGHTPETRKQGGSAFFDVFDSIILWRATMGKPMLRIPQCGSTVALSPDGFLLASGAGTNCHLSNNILLSSGDQRLHLWEVASGRDVLKRPVTDAAVVAFSPDGQTLAVGTARGVVLAWDIVRAGRMADVGKPKDAEALWLALADPKAERAFQAGCTLALASHQAVALIRGKLRPIAVPDAGRVRRLIGQLGDKRFAVRKAADRQLRSMGDIVDPDLREALAGRPSLEVRRRLEDIRADWRDAAQSPEQMRPLRAVWVLEQIGTSAAKETLQELATGAEGAGLTRAAKAALAHLARRCSAR
jgi:WD40 repeat protein